MVRHQTMAALAAAGLLALPLQALAHTDRWHDWSDRRERADRGPENRLVDKYDSFAGSAKNARELVEGLRNDSQIELSKGGKTTTFTPATGKMGGGNVDHALALAKASLAEHGIHNPTPEQIKAASTAGRSPRSRDSASRCRGCSSCARAAWDGVRSRTEWASSSAS